MRRWFVLLLGYAALGCTTGEGEGFVRSERLFVKDCWDGEFDLGPTFFGANPFSHPDGTDVFFRIQRGDNTEEVSDGVTIMVRDVERVRGQLGQPLELGLPSALEVLGEPEAPSTASSTPISLSLYLMDSCQAQNAVLSSIGGTITFASLFSGDPNESNADDRLTEATFTAEVADPRMSGGDANPVSTLTGEFRFFFQRGQPAQPFP